MPPMQHRPAFVSAIVLLSSGCASGVALEAGHEGYLPRPSSVVLVADDAVPQDLELAVKAGLVDQRLVPSGQPAYLARLSFAQVQGRLGLVALDRSRSKWALAPARSRAMRTSRATVIVSDVGSGREILRAYANERAREPQQDVARRLGEALVQQVRGGAISP